MRQTRSQKMAQKAYSAVDSRFKSMEKDGRGKYDGNKDKYCSFARQFPALIHSCGLAQAVAFALSKEEEIHKGYVEDLAAVLQAGGYADLTNHRKLDEKVRVASLTTYLRLSYDALLAAVWLKRYVEAISEEKDESGGDRSSA